MGLLSSPSLISTPLTPVPHPSTYTHINTERYMRRQRNQEDQERDQGKKPVLLLFSWTTGELGKRDFAFAAAHLKDRVRQRTLNSLFRPKTCLAMGACDNVHESMLLHVLPIGRFGSTDASAVLVSFTVGFTVERPSFLCDYVQRKKKHRPGISSLLLTLELCSVALSFS